MTQDALAAAPSKSREEQLLQAIQFDKLEEAERLLTAGADPNAKSGVWGRPLLLAAARKQNGAFVRALIGTGADVNARSNTGETALMAAVRQGYEGNIRYLLSKGANAALTNAEGQSAADMSEKILEQNRMHMLSQALDGALRENERQLLDKWHGLTALLKQAEKDAMSVALKGDLSIRKPLQLRRS
ncbi:MAG: ankyrin repeat domain-containing protein [Alphaproteobacteria bacterium]|nr:MAG: ankyrin repeat domain-containing protein [Alphaproteobacteria bacterium]